MTILITGGLGFIGSHVVSQLREDLVILDNLSNSSLDILDKLKKLTGKNLTFVKGELTDSRVLESIFSSYEIHTVMHFAALKSVGESQKYPELYHKVNVEGTILLLNTMEKYGCKNFIYSSSATVYGNSRAPVRENSLTGQGLSCNYAQNKYDIEEYLKRSTVDRKVVILRYFNPIGAHSSGSIGENPNGIPNNIFPYLLRVAQYSNGLSQEKAYSHFTIYGDNYNTEDGTCIRDYIHVEDLARAHIEVLSKINEGPNLKIYNVGTGKGTSVLELVKTLNTVLKRNSKNQITYLIGERREGDLDVSYANSNKIYQEIGFKTKYDIERMCEDGLRFVGL